MLFADVVILIDKIHREVNAKLEVWREILLSKGFRFMSRFKTEYLECKFNGGGVEGGRNSEMDTQTLCREDNFKYVDP